MGSFNRGTLVEGLTQGRISSTFNGAYEFSAFLLLILPVYLNSIFEGSNKKVKNIIMCAMIFFCIYISMSRSSLIIALLILVIMFIRFSKINIKKLTMAVCILCLLGSVLIVSNPLKNIDLSRFENVSVSGFIKLFEITWKYKNFDNYILTDNWYGNSPYSLITIEQMGMDASLYMRVSHWMQMIDGLLRSPIVGLGASISGNTADGNYVRIICESGILGLGMWLSLLIVIYKSLKTDNKIQRITKYSFITLIIGASLIDLFEASKVMMMFWFMLGVSYASEDINKEIGE